MPSPHDLLLTPFYCFIWTKMYNNVIVIAHNGIGTKLDRKDVRYFMKFRFEPSPTMFITGF